MLKTLQPILNKKYPPVKKKIDKKGYKYCDYEYLIPRLCIKALLIGDDESEDDEQVLKEIITALLFQDDYSLDKSKIIFKILLGASTGAE